MLALIPLFPFAGFLINACFGRRLPKSVSGLIATGAMGLSFGVSAMVVWNLIHLEPVGGVRAVEQTVYTWISSGPLHIPLTFRVDPLAAIMILIVTGIGSLIHLYSTAYMHEETDGEYARYFSYLNLFAAFMLVLVLGANFPVMFIGWEGVGLCSYLLIGFWYEVEANVVAGKKAFIVNRVGDASFVIGLFLLVQHAGTLDVAMLQEKAPELAKLTLGGWALPTVICLLLFGGATGKSAQIPLFVWLPDAMAGPTPVSALIHAATMVTAGVYMVTRLHFLFMLPEAAPALAVIAWIGALTAFLAATIAIAQADIKKVLAYSTVSQLGYMFLAMGVGAYAAGIFHLYTHAFFKALMFLGSGAVIHALAGEQDMRHMGGLKKYLPVTYWTFLIGALAIAGIPPLAGFFSKDEILFRAMVGTEHGHGSTILWLIGSITALLTAIYMFRLVIMTFHGESRFAAASAAVPGGHGHAPAAAHGAHDHGHGGQGHHGTPHEAPPSMAIPLIVLAIGSVVAGFVGVPQALGGGNRIEHFLEPAFEAHGTPEAGAAAEGAAAQTAEGTAEAHGDDVVRTEQMLVALSTGVAAAGIGIAFFIWGRRRDIADRLARQFSGVYNLLLNKYYVDEIYDALIVQPIKRTSEGALWKGIDAGLIDGTVNGVGTFVRGASQSLRQLQTGSVRTYAASLFLGAVMILGWYLWT